MDVAWRGGTGLPSQGAFRLRPKALAEVEQRYCVFFFFFFFLFFFFPAVHHVSASSEDVAPRPVLDGSRWATGSPRHRRRAIGLSDGSRRREIRKPRSVAVRFSGVHAGRSSLHKTGQLPRVQFPEAAAGDRSKGPEGDGVWYSCPNGRTALIWEKRVSTRARSVLAPAHARAYLGTLDARPSSRRLGRDP